MKRRPRGRLGLPLVAWAGALGWAAAIFWFSSRTGAELPRSWILGHDKVLHGAEYALLGGLVWHALARSGVRGRWSVVAATLLALGYGIGDEYHQSFVSGRQGNDPGDLVADGAGATIGAVALHRLAGRRIAAGPVRPQMSGVPGTVLATAPAEAVVPLPPEEHLA